MTELRPLKVFLCHASAGKSVVRKLSHRLAAEGWIDPWLDEEKLSFGQHWTTVIEDALDAADIVLIFLSRNSVQKEGFVQRELNYAWELSLEKPRNVIFLIPFRLDDCEVPRYLSSRQWGDYFGEKEESTYQILLRSLKQRHEQKLRLEAEEQKQREAANRERMEREAKENAERDAAEKLALEKVERENAELAREIAEREAAEKAARKKAERKAAEKAAREKAEREAAEKAAREKAERETAEKAKREKAEREAAEKAKPITIAPSVGQIAPSTSLRTGNLSHTPARKFNSRKIGITGIALIALLCGIYGIFYAINNWPATVPPTPASRPPTKTATFTPKPPTATITPVPPTFTPAPGIGSTMISEIDGMTLVFVPAGEFTMGSETYDDEKPIYQVTLDSYWIDQTEVTNKMYALCVEAGACQLPSSTSSYTRKDYYGNSEFENYPVIYVDWNKAKTYCEWAGRRLPTEAEWEKAARGTDARTYPWGNDAPNSNLLNYNGNVGDTTEVGKYPSGVSIYGALDLAGNVWEWVSSLYQTYPYSATDGREDLDASGSRVLRGGAWGDYEGDVRSADRNWVGPSVTYYVVGFRCALSP